MKEKKFLSVSDINYLKTLLEGQINAELEAAKANNQNIKRGDIVGQWKSKLNIAHTNTINHWLNGTSTPSNKMLDDLREEMWKNSFVELGEPLDANKFRKLFSATNKEEKVQYNTDISAQKSIVDDESFALSLSHNLNILEEIISDWNENVPCNAAVWITKITDMKFAVDSFFKSMAKDNVYLYGLSIPRVFTRNVEDNIFYFLFSDQKRNDFRNTGIELKVLSS